MRRNPQKVVRWEARRKKSPAVDYLSVAQSPRLPYGETISLYPLFER
jgi:hypothetical protein